MVQRKCSSLLSMEPRCIERQPRAGLLNLISFKWWVWLKATELEFGRCSLVPFTKVSFILALTLRSLSIPGPLSRFAQVNICATCLAMLRSACLPLVFSHRAMCTDVFANLQTAYCFSGGSETKSVQRDARYPVKQTMSPSMDIGISSNFERRRMGLNSSEIQSDLCACCFFLGFVRLHEGSAAWREGPTRRCFTR